MKTVLKTVTFVVKDVLRKCAPYFKKRLKYKIDNLNDAYLGVSKNDYLIITFVFFL